MVSGSSAAWGATLGRPRAAGRQHSQAKPRGRPLCYPRQAMSADAWNPTQYERFRAERAQPFFDLLALVQPTPGMRVVDLGCGTGELTAELHARLGARETLGIDRSAAMLERCVAHARPGLSFAPGDIAAFAATAGAPATGATTTEATATAASPAATPTAATGFDLIFSNAALHWVPDHEGLLARLAAALADGGQLAVQVPANHDHPAPRTATELAAEEPFAGALAAAACGGEAPHNAVLRPEAYAALLDRLGFAEQHVRLQVYAHHLASREAVVEWVRGTTLTAYEQRLSPALFGEFLERYRARLLPRLADVRPLFFPFKRILLWGRRPPGGRDDGTARGASE